MATPVMGDASDIPESQKDHLIFQMRRR